MRNSGMALMAALATMLTVPALAATEKGTADEAIAMTRKAVAFLSKEGPDAALTAFTGKDPRFNDRDLYVIVYGQDGKCLAHGANPKLVGKDLIENQDTDGKFYIRERVEAAKSKSSFWLDYKFTNPTTKKIEPKSTYCETSTDKIVCVGIYK
ncbi:cache domain-containing protein [Magnetospirillum molischianum]|uniref:Cache, type 2 n=1 Tax=Magnetospirillum molischianum DSM 120 TaxID=1150626 RepID=H8FX39_MAGML|nr:cache domain-containing protein [Magnetospirillum molischianum]CCG42927.1 Cache, type 2 [Magnetospirillum molischianum DSM 120]